jgi:hypothetical protein
MHFSILRKPHLFIPIAGLVLAVTVSGDPSNRPAWWTDGIPPVITPNAAENNQGPANIGQAKHMVSLALRALDTASPTIASQIRADLAGTQPDHSDRIIDLTVPAPKDTAWIEKQKAPLLLGQLKAIAHPFYTQLHAAAPTWLAAERTANGTNNPGSIFPWTATTDDDSNRSIATIGQLKAVFSLRFETLPSPDFDDDGLADAWEILYFSNLAQPGSGDFDSDGLSNLQEQAMGTNPSTIGVDGDGDGLPDDWELANAGRFAAYPPLLSASLFRDQASTSPILLSNNTGSSVNYTLTVADNTGPGYSFKDSKPGGLIYTWDEISSGPGMGTRLTSADPGEDVSQNDDAWQVVALTGFTFPFAGQNFDEVHVSSNGLLTFVDPSTDYVNQALPTTSPQLGFIAALWDDLNTESSGDIYWKEEGDHLIVQYQNVGRTGDSSTFTFQVVLFSDGRIHLRYKTLSGLTDQCTVGFQNVNQTVFMQMAYDENYLTDELLIEIRPFSEFFTVSSLSGTVAAHSVAAVSGNFQSLKLPPSIYQATVLVANSSPGSVQQLLKARLDVKNTPSTIELISPAPGAEIALGASLTLTATASDPEGLVRVEFYNGATKLGQSESEPYEWTWNMAPSGIHSLTARAIDVFGGVTTSAPVTLTVLENDGMDDVWELANGLNPNIDDSLEDRDGDRIPNIFEYAHRDIGNSPPIYIVNQATGGNSATDNVYTTIKEAVDKANQSVYNAVLGQYEYPNQYAIIHVKAAEYVEQVSLSGVPVLLLAELGAVFGPPTISGSANWDGDSLYIRSASVVDGFIITHNLGRKGVGVRVVSSYGGTSHRRRLVNCVVRGNENTFGGGVNNDAALDLVHCTITGNVGTSEGRGVYNGYGASLDLINSIVWGNSGAASQEIFKDPGSVSRVTTSIVAGAATAEEGINENPLLASEWRLTAGSPAVKRGSLVDNGVGGSILNASLNDIDGDIRPDGPSPNLPDLGADQYHDIPGSLVLTAPTGSFSILEGGAVDFHVTGSDVNGIAKVEFFDGSAWVGTSFGDSQYHSLYNYQPPAGNTRDFRAKMIDFYGGVTFSNSAQISVVDSDTDDDGLPDAWELQYLPNLNQSGSSNGDGDGMNNTLELLAGRNPAAADPALDLTTRKLDVFNLNTF